MNSPSGKSMYWSGPIKQMGIGWPSVVEISCQHVRVVHLVQRYRCSDTRCLRSTRWSEWHILGLRRVCSSEIPRCAAFYPSSCRRHAFDESLLSRTILHAGGTGRVREFSLMARVGGLSFCFSATPRRRCQKLLKLQDPSPAKLFGFRVRSPPLPYLLSSQLQSAPQGSQRSG